MSASGGTEKVRYRMSAGYDSDNGPLITRKDYYRRMNIGSFISADVTDWFYTRVGYSRCSTQENNASR